MNFESPDLFISFKHIEADSPEKLEELMLILQVKSKKPINFSTPSFNNDKWHTWFSHNFAKDIKAKHKLQYEYDNPKGKKV